MVWGCVVCGLGLWSVTVVWLLVGLVWVWGLTALSYLNQMGYIQKIGIIFA